ncbi:MAG: VTT domain-containing protein [Methylobacter sp.]|nr:VTT domain-containing protein [Methylobacter sp.]
MQQHNIELIRKSSIALVFVGVVLFFGHILELHLPDLEIRIQKLGAYAPAGFIAVFVLLAPVFVSVDALCFAAGLLFPLGAGVFYIILATYLAAALIFFLGRYLFRQRVLAFIARHERFAALDAAFKQQPFKLMFLLRLTPLPFAMLSYAMSVAQVRFWSYLGATSGILIYNISLVYLGFTTKHMAALMSGSSKQSSISYPLLAAGLVISVLVLVYVAKMAANTINRIKPEKTGQDNR